MMEKQNRSYCVYIHTFPNGKVYVGITGEANPEKRWRRGKNYRNNIYLTRAFEKYGWDNVEHSVIEKGLSKEEAEAKERMLIAFFNSNDSKHGYNITSGGECIGKHSIETRKKLSAITKARYEDPEYRRHMSEVHKGKTPWSKGLKMSDEFRKKISEAKKGCPGPNPKAVMCVETGVVYKSMAEAGKVNGTCQSKISLVCSGKGAQQVDITGDLQKRSNYERRTQSNASEF